MKEKIKRFMLSKTPDLICLIVQLIALIVLVFVKPCGFAAYLVGLLCGFIISKILARVSYHEKKAQEKSSSSKKP